jgi:peptidoglycan-associated lipoprotein
LGEVTELFEEAMFMFNIRKIVILALVVWLVVFAVGCKKKVPAPPPPPQPIVQPPPPPPPPPPAPTVVQFTADPASIQRGQSATLRWEVSGQATNVSINQGIGTVQNTGSQRVSPTDSTTWTLTATGPGGSNTARATVNVTAPPPPPPPPPAPPVRPVTIDQRLTSTVQDALFDYDKSDIRADAQDTLTRDATALKTIMTDFPNAVIVVEGHCDERGSAEYNLGLGDRRASSAKEFLVQLGVPADKLRTVSFGKERPQCSESNETCWQKNRRAHFSAGQ